jgi:hypothetical protein
MHQRRARRRDYASRRLLAWLRLLLLRILIGLGLAVQLNWPEAKFFTDD